MKWWDSGEGSNPVASIDIFPGKMRGGGMHVGSLHAPNPHSSAAAWEDDVINGCSGIYFYFRYRFNWKPLQCAECTMLQLRSLHLVHQCFLYMPLVTVHLLPLQVSLSQPCTYIGGLSTWNNISITLIVIQTFVSFMHPPGCAVSAATLWLPTV